jgi:hypothetical protein
MINFGEQGKLKSSLGLRLHENDPLLPPVDVVESQATDVG